MESAEEIYSPDEVQKLGQSLLRGGLWSDEAGKIAGEWKGESTVKPPPTGAPKIGRNTARQEAARTLKASTITEEEQDALKQVISAAISKKLGLGKDETIKFALDSMRSMIESDIRKWIADVSSKIAENKPQDLSGVEHRLNILEEKLTVLQNLQTTRSTEERQLFDLALQTINDAKVDDDDTASKASHVARLELRQKELERQIANLELRKTSDSPLNPNTRIKIESDPKARKKFVSTVY